MTKRSFDKSFDQLPTHVNGQRVILGQCRTYLEDGPAGAYNETLHDCLDFFSLFDHPSLPSILDRGTFEGCPAFMMPYRETTPVGCLFNFPESMPIEVIKYVILCTMDALDHFYTRQRGFRNLKILRWGNIEYLEIHTNSTGNIFLNWYPNPIEMFRKTYRQLYNLPKKNYLAPKLYSSPETLRGRTVSSELTDIFMVGSFLWRLLAHAPFAVGSHFDMLRYVLRGEFPAPSTLRGGIPPEMDALCMSMIKKDTQARCQSFAAARDALLAVNVSQDEGREILARLAYADRAEREHAEQRFKATQLEKALKLRDQKIKDAQTTEALFNKSFDHYQAIPNSYNFAEGYPAISPDHTDGGRVLIHQCNIYLKEGPSPTAHKRVLNDCLDFFSLFDHPSLPSILDRGTFAGCPAFLTPYRETVPIGCLLNGPAQMPIEVIKHVMLCAMDALNHFYSRQQNAKNIDQMYWSNINFSDICSDVDGNIFVDYPYPLTLFELTYKNRYELEPIKRLTPTLYTSPERFRGRHISNELTDIFMVGSFLWRFLTGEYFVRGSSDFDMLRYILRGEFPAPSALREGILPEMDALCMSMIEKDPQARCQSFAAARDALLAVDVSQDEGREMLARLACAEHTRKIHTERQLRQKFQRDPTAQTPATSTSTSSWWSRWWSRLRKN